METGVHRRDSGPQRGYPVWNPGLTLKNLLGTLKNLLGKDGLLDATAPHSRVAAAY